MKTPRAHIGLVDPGERLPLRLGGSTIYYRRLSLGALAAIEEAHTVLVPGRGEEPPRAVLPRAALEAACLAHVLVGWEGVLAPDGAPARFGPDTARRLPGGVRRLVLRRARSLWTPTAITNQEARP